MSSPVLNLNLPPWVLFRPSDFQGIIRLQMRLEVGQFRLYSNQPTGSCTFLESNLCLTAFSRSSLSWVISCSPGMTGCSIIARRIRRASFLFNSPALQAGQKTFLGEQRQLSSPNELYLSALQIVPSSFLSLVSRRVASIETSACLLRLGKERYHFLCHDGREGGSWRQLLLSKTPSRLTSRLSTISRGNVQGVR